MSSSVCGAAPSGEPEDHIDGGEQRTWEKSGGLRYSEPRSPSPPFHMPHFPGDRRMAWVGTQAVWPTASANRMPYLPASVSGWASLSWPQLLPLLPFTSVQGAWGVCLCPHSPRQNPCLHVPCVHTRAHPVCARQLLGGSGFASWEGAWDQCEVRGWPLPSGALRSACTDSQTC